MTQNGLKYDHKSTKWQQRRAPAILMPQSQRSKYNLRYLRQWPYIVLAGPEKSTIHPSISKEAIVENIIGLSPLVSIPEIW